MYAEIDRGDLVVTKQVYKKDDPVTSPSGENVITYRWTAGRFALEYRTHNEYSDAVDGAHRRRPRTDPVPPLYEYRPRTAATTRDEN